MATRDRSILHTASSLFTLLCLGCSSSPSASVTRPSASPDGGAQSADADTTMGLSTNPAGADGGSDGAPTSIPPGRAGASVLSRHKNATRDGLYVDPLMTRAAVRGLHVDPAFLPPPITGPVYAQPLYVEKGANGAETLYIVTDQNIVYALDANTGSQLWQAQVGTPVAQQFFECANIDPVGVTGTPVIDINSRSIFLDALNSDDGGMTKRHMLYALSLDDGKVRHNYPVDLGAKLASQGVTFDPAYEQQRGALTLLQNRLYIPFGGYAGDCGSYHGFVVGVPIENSNQVYSWFVPGLQGGIWGVGGPASDGQSLFIATGNTDTRVTDWAGGEAVIRLGPGPTYSGSTNDYFVPSNWRDLDQGDLELGGTQPIVLDMPGAAHPALVVAFAKNGNVYVLDRNKLGGIAKGDGTSGEGLSSGHFTNDYIVNAGAAYTTTTGTYVVFKGAGVNCPTGSTLLAVKIGRGDPPSIDQAWCAAPDASGSPIVSTTDGHSEPVVWTLGADGDGKLHAFDGETGQSLFDGGQDVFPPTARFQSPIVFKGRAVWVSNEQVFAFTVK